MTNILLTNLSSYRQYFQDIASQSPFIDGFRWGDEEIVKNDVRADLPQSFLWVMPYESSRYAGNDIDNEKRVKVAVMSYMLIPESNKFTDIDTAADTAEGVIELLVGRIQRDQRGRQVNTDWIAVATAMASITTKPVEYTLGSTRYIGCELSIEFRDNARLSYNSNKWLDTAAGAVWVRQPNTGVQIQALTFGLGLFIGVAPGGAGLPGLRSSNGKTWSTFSLFNDSPGWQGVEFDNGTFVAVGSTRISTSPDGLAWTFRATPDGILNSDWNSAAYGNGTWVIVGSSEESDLFAGQRR
ncbi:MAG: hypothetical protein WDO15_11470 [Bacteroidota bacterium]